MKAVCDAGLVMGFLAFVYGLSLAWRPLGFIVGGAILASCCFLIGYRGLKAS
jgi:hypothetical protein